MPKIARPGILRKALWGLMGISALAGMSVGIYRAGRFISRPEIEMKAACQASRCEINLRGRNTEFLSRPPLIGVETGCGARTVEEETQVINDYWTRFVLDIRGMVREEPCDLWFGVDGHGFTYPDAIRLK